MQIFRHRFTQTDYLIQHGDCYIGLYKSFYNYHYHMGIMTEINKHQWESINPKDIPKFKKIALQKVEHKLNETISLLKNLSILALAAEEST